MYNGVSFYGCHTPINDVNEWFKIRIGKQISGYGDWGGGFEYASCAIAEVYIDVHCRIIQVIVPPPFDNASPKTNELYKKVKSLVDKEAKKLEDKPKVETRDAWLRGVLDTLHSICYISSTNVWQHTVEITKPDEMLK